MRRTTRQECPPRDRGRVMTTNMGNNGQVCDTECDTLRDTGNGWNTSRHSSSHCGLILTRAVNNSGIDYLDSWCYLGLHDMRFRPFLDRWNWLIDWGLIKECSILHSGTVFSIFSLFYEPHLCEQGQYCDTWPGLGSSDSLYSLYSPLCSGDDTRQPTLSAPRLGRLKHERWLIFGDDLCHDPELIHSHGWVTGLSQGLFWCWVWSAVSLSGCLTGDI